MRLWAKLRQTLSWSPVYMGDVSRKSQSSLGKTGSFQQCSRDRPARGPGS